MEIVLLQSVKGLGNAGEVKDIKRGYASNYLIPNGFALPATVGNLKEAKSRTRKIERKREVELEELKSIISEIDGLEIKIIQKASKEGKLFGSVKAKDIAEEVFKKINKKIKEEYIELPEPLKKVGEYDIEIKGNEEIKASIKVLVKAEEEKK